MGCIRIILGFFQRSPSIYSRMVVSMSASGDGMKADMGVSNNRGP